MTNSYMFVIQEGYSKSVYAFSQNRIRSVRTERIVLYKKFFCEVMIKDQNVHIEISSFSDMELFISVHQFFILVEFNSIIITKHLKV